MPNPVEPLILLKASVVERSIMFIGCLPLVPKLNNRVPARYSNMGLRARAALSTANTLLL